METIHKTTLEVSLFREVYDVLEIFLAVYSKVMTALSNVTIKSMASISCMKHCYIKLTILIDS